MLSDRPRKCRLEITRNEERQELCLDANPGESSAEALQKLFHVVE